MQAESVPQAKKRFGQNFLVQPAIVQRIVAAVGPGSSDALVEIGPGRGALTRALLAALAPAQRLRVIELDRDLLPILRNLAPPERLEILAADALKVDFLKIADTAGARLRIVGNLPYNISTPLLFHLLGQAEAITDMHFMLQREVVERIVARPGSGTYGRLSVMLQAYCLVEMLFPVAPGNFHPVPKVDSAFLRLVPRHPTPIAPARQALFAEVVRLAFAQRRKTLANNFRSRLPAPAWEQLAIDPGRRAETLSVDDFFRLTEALDTAGVGYGPHEGRRRPFR
ncbi:MULTISPECIES: 16S rRNA (adenine(1518)-N(6)/adenine(1519)-N(6))-dimethyltransferase RsmA [Acidithiobacillus]|uniref:Ribosomal RNA small subunit methyltransferase A n=3 Tax=Acidithiobacillus caldus TaxID=33059 RepID=F9ZTS5_ACICS|nr:MULTISPECIES: 16S rRNA (adenine(1518)-N(6)/adenine(1519)-N(6))-dimethyltransferase RsmA [Acidithiobacillus]AEK59489.1 Dimethyladenosine transferase [Acidithiobacillus caldus SM-1]AIA56532.1 SSU rRNA (adenine(1518)-N(6)/adenine(1519)-N(6))-dimethyltransferase [Acidithiobacillus caldus ATCC 51756]AUW33851.1 16S rRNA (adenine(1518)-N(6)/adenine(1519)-N(6))-dimethyltransferase RsmA [Acidithiobacillus caldus]MBU2729360.1 16S rRNA (adenine(1518)-N(6)/adenine(1519)-N(6))-dimethyltransferase RsmA [A